eukprot:CAMPEP_0184353432 /NCGR_PEP_ID=MMETSP1089-20130417/78889_1 /TAXON_ID=38269 ORGANISM="Gloeochaete wittrockiana, Strain SAG46.84" /NCGR_SAMPLE_ID=MMETSP1089 /ASSEMBLY_ACC=CAM_ASM_000445 /LENGTH=97 /DNA_ID=CAMNT_0026688831 /DNA_START=211 /DNA_END=501 /DNA_ORIENTATION=+
MASRSVEPARYDACSVRSLGAESMMLLQAEETKSRNTEDALFSILFCLIEKNDTNKLKRDGKHHLLSFNAIMEVFDVLQLASLACGSGAWHSPVAAW